MKSRLVILPALVIGLVCAGLWLFVVSARPSRAASVLKVCPTCAYTTIQAAVDAAANGDLIKVAGGTYDTLNSYGGHPQVVYVDKSVTIRGGYSTSFGEPPMPEILPTIIDAQGLGRGVYVVGSINPVLEYLNITNGNATGLGGGLGGQNGVGGGVYLVSATAAISGCHIYNNIASASTSYGSGGGVYLQFSSSELRNNKIYSNVAAIVSADGGGVYISGGSPKLIENLIYDNYASSLGDTDMGWGGGIYLEDSHTVLYDNIVYSNTANRLGHGYGGGIYFGPYDQSRLYNNVLMHNVSGALANSRGSGAIMELASPSLYHTTLHDNTGGDGSGVHLFASSAAAMTNTILVNQTVGISVSSGSNARVTGVLWFNNGANYGGAGVINLTGQHTGNPLFDLDGYHILDGSAAEDMGLGPSLARDIDAQGRPGGNDYDLGADELYWLGRIIHPASGGVLEYVNPLGMTTTVAVPPGATNMTIRLVYRPLDIRSPFFLPPGKRFAGHSFGLEAYNSSGYLLPGFTFDIPAIVSVRYSDADVYGIVEESLRIFYWDGSGWIDALNTCSPPTNYTRDLGQNILSVPICHLTRWDMVGTPEEEDYPGDTYLPLVFK